MTALIPRIALSFAVFSFLGAFTTSAAPIQVTVFFGTGVTLGPGQTQGTSGLFDFSGSGGTTRTDLVAPGISLSVASGLCGTATCAVYGTADGMGSIGSTQTADGLVEQVAGNGTEFISFTFSMPVTIRGMILGSISSDGGGDGAQFLRILPSAQTVFDDGNLTDPGFGTYNAVAQTSTISGLSSLGTQWQIRGTDGNDDFYIRALTFEYDDAASAIPEPSTFGLLGLGIGLWFVARRRPSH